MQLTPEELKAVAIVVSDYARRCGEDIIGAFMFTGAFRVLKDGENSVVELSRKIEELLEKDTTT